MTPNSSLLQWLATFELDGEPSIKLDQNTPYSLADGYICGRILNQICPEAFPDNWLEGIKPVPPNGSWRLRVSNLKRILRKTHDYACALQTNQFRIETIDPDVVVIAQNFDHDQISKLIQLILFCAINCKRRDEYIEKIRRLPTRVKEDIKDAIEELLRKSPELCGIDGTNLSPLRTQQSAGNMEKEKITGESSDKDSQSTRTTNSPGNMSEFRTTLASSHILQRDSTSTRSDDESNFERNLILQQNKMLLSQLQMSKEEAINAEAERDDYREKCRLLKDDLNTMSRKYDEARNKAEEFQRIQDELDEMKHLGEKVAKCDTQIQIFEKRNNELKSEIERYREENNSQKDRISVLEGENGKLSHNAIQILLYKNKIQEIQTKLSQESHRADKAELELSTLNREHSLTKKENKRLNEMANHLMTLNNSNSSDKSEQSDSLAQRVEKLQALLSQKEQELADSEAKYQRNIKKAKEVIKHLNQQTGALSVPGNSQTSCISSISSLVPCSLDENNALRQQVKDRDERIVELEKEFLEYKKFKEAHERLMISAFYGLTTTMQWKNAEKRLEKSMNSMSNGGQKFS